MMMDFIKYAAMAPSTRNTRPWILGFSENQIRVMPDLTRWLPVDDPDQKQLYVSLGCALENICIAATAHQFDTRMLSSLDSSEPQIVLDLIRNNKIEKTSLFDALEKRSTYRGGFADVPVSSQVAKLFQEIGGDALVLTTDKKLVNAIEDLNIQAEVSLYSDPNFCTEMEANPAVMWLHPSVLIRKLQLFSRLYLGEDISSSRVTAPLMGIFFVEEWNRKNWVDIGATFERIFLTATERQLKFRPISNCLRNAKWRDAVKALFPHKKGIPTIAFYCGLATGNFSEPAAGSP